MAISDLLGKLRPDKPEPEIKTKELEALRQEITALEAEILSIIRESQQRDQTYSVMHHKAAAVDYGKSEYDYLSTHPHYVASMYYRFQTFWRNFSLMRELYGMPEPHVPPPRALASDVWHALSMGGRIPVVDAYFAAEYPRHFEVVFANNEIETFDEMLGGALRPRAAVSPRLLKEYRQAANAMLNPAGGDPMRTAIARHVTADVSVATYGSIVPLYETICLRLGASPVAIGRGPIRSEDPRITTLTHADVVRSGRKFDRVLAPLMVHRAGLGLLEDEVDPDGDLAMLAKLRDLLEPNGLLMMTLPVGPDLVLYNSARVYGSVRLPLLLRGWHRVDMVGLESLLALPEKTTLVTFVLRPVQPAKQS
jgi:hypothetical protein